MTSFSLTIALAAAAALAPGDDAKGAAQAHLDRGNELFTRDLYAEALAEFAAAHALYPSARLEFNMGQCERALGHAAAAIDHFRKFLDGGGGISPALRAETERYLDELGRVAPPPAPAPPLLQATAAPAPPPPPPAPLTHRWWFWTAIGAVAAGAAVGIVLFVRRPQDPACNLDEKCY